jgi:LPS O-antigen subunit length determinant protein (WzzB/FepE family)
VERAIPPDRKSAPHRTVIVLIFTLLGMLGAWSYVLSRNLVSHNSRISQLLAEFKSVPISE